MTIPNRTVSITGIFAADASTTIPQNPVPGASYRDTTMTGTVVREGWAFKTIVDSSKFNQSMYEYSSVTAQIEKYGFLPWSNLTDYVQGSVCLGSNGMLYQAKQATGPSTTAVDPTTDSSVWQQIILGNTNSLFDHKWEDYILNRMDWLRADTFSWQDGGVYKAAYDHLVADATNGTSQTETISGHTITYTLADDGHKIVSDVNASEVEGLYNDTGVAWYYILDLVNHRFKLPRENPARELLGQSAPVIGDGKTIGLQNSSKNFGLYNYGSDSKAMPGLAESAYGTSKGTTITPQGVVTPYQGLGLSQDSTKSGMIAKLSETTGAYKGKQYLYFYVGNYTQSATEQTAGLNSELFNGKADIDMGNVPSNIGSTAKSYFAGIGMPSDTYEDLTYGGTSDFHVAPANGFIYIAANKPSNDTVVGLTISSENQTTTAQVNANPLYQSFTRITGYNAGVWMAIRKNQTFIASGGTEALGNVVRYRFIYAEGEI